MGAKPMMSEFEIVKSFNEAKKPTAQIKVLSELNCVSEDVIKNILLENGVDHRKLTRKKRKSSQAAVSPLKIETQERERESRRRLRGQLRMCWRIRLFS